VTVRWYLNDASLQGQFADSDQFLALLRRLLKVRQQSERLRGGLRTTRGLPLRPVSSSLDLRTVVQESRDRELVQLTLAWLNATGPFTEDDRTAEPDDYFEYLSLDVTDSGLGEATRRVKGGELAMTFSFPGGVHDFAHSPLLVSHGLPEDLLGTYSVPNAWESDALAASVVDASPPIRSWRALVETARERFPRLIIPDAVFLNRALSGEAFNAVIADAALRQMGYLDAYMAARDPDGSDGPRAREIVEQYFTGDRAPFSGESASNQRDFRDQMTFADPEVEGAYVFAHWHGKISHRFFRMHFEWPVPGDRRKLKVLYIGPKITKS
jgi:hypothetical protein